MSEHRVKRCQFTRYIRSTFVIRHADIQGLEGFRLVEKMGDGAFSNVYKAVDRKTGRKVAVKVVRKYELNHSQVSFLSYHYSLCIYPLHLCCLLRPGQAGTKAALDPLLFFSLFILFCLRRGLVETCRTKTDGGEGQQTSQRKVQEEAKSHRGSSSFLFPNSHSLAVAGPRASGVCRISLPPFLFSLPLWQLFVALRLAPPSRLPIMY
jgi:serine/threonine protein kinase